MAYLNYLSREIASTLRDGGISALLRRMLAKLVRYPNYLRREIASTLRYDGISILLWRVLVKLVRPFGWLSIQILFDMDIAVELKAAHLPADLVIREASEADLDAIVDVYLQGEAEAASTDDSEADQAAPTESDEYDEYYDIYLERLRRGEKCFLGFVGNEIVHVNWTCRTWCEAIEGHPVILLPGEVYTTDAVTKPTWRGRGIHEAVLAAMLISAQRDGRDRAYTMTNLTKVSSRKGLRRLGWKVYGVLLCFVPRIFDRIWIFRLRGQMDPLFRDLPSLSGGP